MSSFPFARCTHASLIALEANPFREDLQALGITIIMSLYTIIAISPIASAFLLLLEKIVTTN